jgi:hypothetical protein
VNGGPWGVNGGPWVVNCGPCDVKVRRTGGWTCSLPCSSHQTWRYAEERVSMLTMMTHHGI